MGVLEQIVEAGKKYNLTPYGTETMHVLRAEKGFIIVGQDTDSSMTPDDLNMGWCVGRTKPFSWIGWRGRTREDCVRADRKQLAGLKPIDTHVARKSAGEGKSVSEREELGGSRTIKKK